MLTTTQLQTLKAYIDSVPEWAALPNNSDSAFFISAELGKLAEPAYTVWRTSLSRHEAQADGFDWTQCDNLTNGQARIWDWIFNTTGVMHPAEVGVRAGISECWKGSAAKVAVATFVLGKCKRAATVCEKVFATGAGTVASPSQLGVDADGNYITDTVPYSTVQDARSLP